MIVKIPVTQAGVQAIEEATYRGISINATVQLHAAPSDRGRRSGRARAEATRTGRPGHQCDGTGLHPHGGAAR